jgi:hypothetical protein
MKKKTRGRILAVAAAAAVGIFVIIVLRLGIPARQSVQCPALEGPEQTAEEQTETTAQTGGDQPALIRVQGKLYRDSGEIDDVPGRCGMMDGSITQQCEGIPTKDGQSNFGAGYGYQYGRTEDSIEVWIDEEWHVFIEYEIAS